MIRHRHIWSRLWKLPKRVRGFDHYQTCECGASRFYSFTRMQEGPEIVGKHGVVLKTTRKAETGSESLGHLSPLRRFTRWAVSLL